MIVVDSSVWIAYLIGADTPQATLLDALIDGERLVVGDLVLCELLQGVDSEGHAARVEAFLGRFERVEMLNASIALIGTFCIEHRLRLLHDDRDFERMERHLGLQVVRPN
jgi:predicted nucleic acid-binding protein